ncbi:MAG: RraA family protein [Thermomicrobiales bacterium]|nr:RraA family protein [Thermomicrobiales bacterium]
MKSGFIIRPLTNRPDAEAMAPLFGLATPLLSDSMGRLPGAAGLLPYHRNARRMVGPAFTVRTRGDDNLMIHKALDMAEPGDVIVVDGGGELSHALVGEMMLTHAMVRKLGGIVIDGAIRDVSAIAAAEFPVFARGVTHRGPYKDGPGQINVPVSIGGMVVNPGDIVVGDEDGVLAFAPSIMTDLIAAASAKAADERAQLEATLNGTLDRSWVDATLRAKGVTGIQAT